LAVPFFWEFLFQVLDDREEDCLTEDKHTSFFLFGVVGFKGEQEGGRKSS